jgi:hypothetical protein
MKMEQTQCSETSAIKHHTPGNKPKDYTQHLEHGESLKSRPNYSKNTCTLTISSEDAVAGEMLSVEKRWGKRLNCDREMFPEHEKEGF